MQTQHLILIVHEKKYQAGGGISSLVTFHCLMSQYFELHLEVICIGEYCVDSEPKQPWLYCA